VSTTCIRSDTVSVRNVYHLPLAWSTSGTSVCFARGRAISDVKVNSLRGRARHGLSAVDMMGLIGLVCHSVTMRDANNCVSLLPGASKNMHVSSP
jgi:hypothetical protein